MPYQRPTGVTILAVLQLIGGILSVLGGIGLLFAGATATPDGPGANSGVATVFGFGLIVSGTIGLIAGYGLFTLKGWGWLLAVIFSILNVLSSLWNLIQGNAILSAIVGLVVSGLILYYLYTPTVKRAFDKL